jgi:hypothetical protein
MDQSFSPANTPPKSRHDLYLIVLLLGSLSLNVYLGWTVSRLKRSPPSPQASVKLLPGMSVQPVKAMSLSGNPETISYSDSVKPTVFYVFSPTCIWCERNSQNINAIVNLKGDSFRFIGVSLATEGLSTYMESHHLSFPVYQSVAPESIEMLGLDSTPQTIVISPDGRVLKNWIGAFGKNVQPEIEQFFNVGLPGLTAQKN